MTTWTNDYIGSLVTDTGVLRDGKSLAIASKWRTLGHNAQAVWGLAQGSAKEPYKACLEFSGGATKCSCPSRKFPCKHCVALMFFLAAQTVPVEENPPEWVASWLETRQQKQQAQAVAAPKAVDSAAQAKRQAARESKVSAGITELRRWTEDLIRSGVSDERIKSYNYWDNMAARMVDSQMSPIAKRLRRLGGKPFQRQSDWMVQLVEEISQLYALTEAYERIETLPELFQNDVRAALGFTQKQEEVIASQNSVRDLWTVLGQVIEEEDRLLTRRTWLFGQQTAQHLLLLDFAHTSRPFESKYPLGSSYDADVVFYPSAYPQRGLIKQLHRSFSPATASAGFTYSVETALDTFADALALNPFLERIPVAFTSAWLSRSNVDDADEKRLPARGVPAAQWLTAVTGGAALPVFGEWDGSAFQPLTILAEDGWIPIE